MADTLIFVHSSVGEGQEPLFPVNALCKIRPHGGVSDIFTSEFVYRRMVAAFANSKVVTRLLTNAYALQKSVGAENTIFHAGRGAGSTLADYVREHPEITTLVRVLGNHTLTDPELVAETLKRFKELPADARTTHKFGPNVCGMGQNIEVFSREAFLSQANNLSTASTEMQARFQEHVTATLPSVDPWPVEGTAENWQQMQETGFQPFISPFPGFVQQRSVENVQTIHANCAQLGLPLTFMNSWQIWRDEKLGFGGWKNEKGYWSDPEFKATSFQDVRGALARGITTIAPPDLSGPTI